MIKKLGFKAQCSKMDVKSAFRLLPMYQGEFDLLGFKIGNWYFIDKFHLSARAYHRILKVARTIADLENSETVNSPHLIEAIGYRRSE
jgi:predicted ATPase with chaperone activity